MEQEQPTTLDCGPRIICRRHIMTGSYLSTNACGRHCSSE
ncbi:hypothetical protein F383_36424 [Gossypium arboreum]|uniref:Uncharacterized protein n=1 Tax=Gossypium arboreum TaxID=29729 RepID=A0A0B0N8P9_GOSAR|nr:hypothetical protein F383_36424 [Gossypium arboreum]